MFLEHRLPHRRDLRVVSIDPAIVLFSCHRSASARSAGFLKCVANYMLSAQLVKGILGQFCHQFRINFAIAILTLRDAFTDAKFWISMSVILESAVQPCN